MLFDEHEAQSVRDSGVGYPGYRFPWFYGVAKPGADGFPEGAGQRRSSGGETGGSILVLSHKVTTLDRLVDWCGSSEHRLLPVHGVGIDDALVPRADLVIVEDGEDLVARAATDQACRTLRQQQSARYLLVVADSASESREREVISAGADYYIAPLVAARLASYVDVLMARALSQRCQPLVLGPLVVDQTRRACTLNGQALGLTRAEFDILQQLAQKAGHLVSIQELARLLGARDTTSSRARIRQHVHVLRHKSPALMSMVRTIRGCGYLLQYDN
jgi:DNA-binding response OmpR family regulator